MGFQVLLNKEQEEEQIILGIAKKNFYELAEYVPDSEIDPEIREKLDAIAWVAESPTSVGDHK